MEWHYAIAGQKLGPVSWDELCALASSGQLGPNDLVWKKGMQDWVPASLVPNLIPEGTAPPPLPHQAAGGNSDRITAGVVAILLGALGIHKFMLGMTTPGLIMLLATVLTCGAAWPVMHLIGIAEGIIYLSKSDAEFYQRYVVEKRSWF